VEVQHPDALDFDFHAGDKGVALKGGEAQRREVGVNVNAIRRLAPDDLFVWCGMGEFGIF
jgi:hypothetical protein